MTVTVVPSRLLTIARMRRGPLRGLSVKLRGMAWFLVSR